jgi:hypothetical protein
MSCSKGYETIAERYRLHRHGQKGLNRQLLKRMPWHTRLPERKELNLSLTVR